VVLEVDRLLFMRRVAFRDGSGHRAGGHVGQVVDRVAQQPDRPGEDRFQGRLEFTGNIGYCDVVLQGKKVEPLSNVTPLLT
jgi:hypothetical protein